MSRYFPLHQKYHWCPKYHYFHQFRLSLKYHESQPIHWFLKIHYCHRSPKCQRSHESHLSQTFRKSHLIRSCLNFQRHLYHPLSRWCRLSLMSHENRLPLTSRSFHRWMSRCFRTYHGYLPRL